MKHVTFAVNLPDNMGFEEIRRVALEVEELGFDCVWFPDHIMSQSPECWATLTALAVETKRIRLGSMMACNLWRQPAILAKMVATIDDISKGRVEFGIGAGHWKGEYIMYGIPFPNVNERMLRLEEAIEITKRMWTEDKANFKGKYYTVRNAVCIPKPVQKPHPPITIGGDGKNLTVAVAAKYANRYNPLPMRLTLDKANEYSDALDNQCLRIGRDPKDIEKIWYGYVFVSRDTEEVKRVRRELGDAVEAHVVGNPEQCIHKIESYVDVGFTHFVYYSSTHYRIFQRNPSPSLKIFAEEVIPHFM